MKIILFLIVFFKAFYLFAALSIAPSYMNISVKPGELYKCQYKIINQGKEDAHATIFINDRWPLLMKGSGYVFGDPDWVWFSTNSITLKASEEWMVDCFVQVEDKNITNVEFLEMISIDEAGPITGRISVPMYIGMEGKANPQLKIKNWFCTNKPDNTWHFFVTVSNSGNIRLFPIVNLTTHNSKKRLLGTWEKQMQNSLGPNSIYKFDFNPITSSSAVLDCDLTIDYSKFGLIRKEALHKTFKIKD